MLSISKEFYFEAAHRLLLHHGKCRNIHGHSYRLIIHVSGELQNNAMIKDFAELTWIKTRLDTHRDHAYIYNPDDIYASKITLDGLKTFNLGQEPTVEAMLLFLVNMIKEQEP
jgi:6-pyruvoyltetrahydropterin/6-carboxytetrahydropterin synthase